MTGSAGSRGWQWLFILEAIPALVLAWVVFFYLDDRPEQARWLSDEEKARVASDLAAEKREERTYARLLPDRAARSKDLCDRRARPRHTGRLWRHGLSAADDHPGESGVHDAFYIGLLSGLPFVVALPSSNIWSRAARPAQRAAQACRDAGAGRGGGLVPDPLRPWHPVLTLLTPHARDRWHGMARWGRSGACLHRPDGEGHGHGRHRLRSRPLAASAASSARSSSAGRPTRPARWRWARPITAPCSSSARSRS